MQIIHIMSRRDTAKLESSNVIKIIPTDDLLFFRKKQIKIGTVLVNVGRRNTLPMYWEVTRIYTFFMQRGQYRSRKVDTVMKLSDAVELKPINPPKGYKRKYMELTFSYLSYSVIWRIRP